MVYINLLAPVLIFRFGLSDDNGIFRFDAKTQEITPFRDAASIGTTYYCIHDLLVDGDKLYAATYGRGLEVIDLKTGKVESFLNNPEDSTSIPSSRVFTLYKASNGCIYVGTSAGFCYYNPEKNNFIRIGSFQAKYRISLKITSEEFGWSER